MAEGTEAEDRTEAATPRRLERAREEGQVPVSRELPALVGLGGFALTLMLLGPGMGEALMRRMAALLAGAGSGQTSAEALHDALLAALGMAAPFLVVAVAGAVVTTLLQTGFLFHAGAWRLDLTRLDPISGIGRLFGVDNLVQTGLSLAKILLAGFACWRVLGQDLPGLAASIHWPVPVLAARLVRAGLSVLLAMLGVQAAIALFDLVRVRVQHMRMMRMSREDIRQETKENEGDPHVKGKLRQLRRARMRKRMMAKVKTATVVVTNPTHYAVALAYDRAKAAAPRVVAKGVDEVAARIRAAAEENHVPLIANPPLARALYRVELDAEIPPEHYKAVAELIAYVWRLAARVGARPAR